MKKDRRVVVIAGPTGSGESTFTNELVMEYPQLARMVSATTRHPRGKEQDGVDYYFMDEPLFFAHVQSGDIPEHTYVEKRHAHYGSYLPDLEAKILAGKIVIVNTDLQGAVYYQRKYNAITIFIHPKSLDVLRERISRRDPSITTEELEIRIAAAAREIEEARGKYDYEVFNDDGEFVSTVEKVVEILRGEGYGI